MNHFFCIAGYLAAVVLDVRAQIFGTIVLDCGKNFILGLYPIPATALPFFNYVEDSKVTKDFLVSRASEFLDLLSYVNQQKVLISIDTKIRFQAGSDFNPGFNILTLFMCVPKYFFTLDHPTQGTFVSSKEICNQAGDWFRFHTTSP